MFIIVMLVLHMNISLNFIFPGELWCRAMFDETLKCDILTNNISESWNKYILEARDKRSVSMLEIIRRLVMVRLQTKRDSMSKCTTLVCPNIAAKVKRSATRSSSCRPYHA